MLYDTRPAYTERIQRLALPTKRSFEVTLQHGTRAQVQLLLPPSWREELRDAAFPVLVEVYVLMKVALTVSVSAIKTTKM